MKASIILLTYRQEKTVARALESLLRQKCPYSWEIVIADDGSPDGTRNICQKYAARYPDLIRLLPYAPNKGIVGNYFDAVEQCRGEYIGDCAGDDEWLDPTRLRRQIEILDADPTLSVVFSDVEEKDGEKVTLHSSNSIRNRWFRPRISGKDLLVADLNHVNTLPYTLSAALYRRSALMKTYASNPEMVRMPDAGIEDVPLIAALSDAGDAAYIPIVGYRYYIDGESASNNLSMEKDFRFTARVTVAGATLARFYGIPTQKLKNHTDAKLSYMAALARHLHDRSLLPEIERCRQAWNIPLPLRARIHTLLLQLLR